MPDLREQFGNIDVYLFDQLLRGRVQPGARVLDVGCGGGRNLEYLLRQGHPVCAADPEPERLGFTRKLARVLAPHLPDDNFRCEPAESMSFAPGSADLVICNAVLHFARDHEHFRAMLDGAWAQVAPGGIFFARLTSSIGLEGARELGGGRFLQPDGDVRYLVTLELLLDEGARLGAVQIDPIKTTSVQGLRSMTTWVLGRDAPGPVNA